KKRLPFQTGILVANASLRNLLIDIKNNYNDISYIMTRRVNSDVLENLFSYLKGMVGSNTHMTPIEFKYCLDVIECFPTGVQADITDDALTSVISYLGGNTKDTEESNLELLDNYDIHYPYSGEKVYHCDDNNSSWTEKITKVNLIRPSSDVIYVANVIEIIFNLYHGNNGLNKSPGIIKKVTNLVINEIKSQIPVEVINCLVQTRTFIRLNNLNKSIANKIFDVKRKKVKKIIC
ncbi:THAP-type domain-containing protein, partial [Aphis craccivora]